MPYVGQDFSATEPGTQRSYTFDFMNDIALIKSQSATIGGTITAGDTIGVTLTHPDLAEGDVTVIVVAGSSDTLTSVAAAVAAKISGLDELSELRITAGAASGVISISFPESVGISLLLDAVLVGANGGEPTETMAFAAGVDSGEIISSAVWTCEVYKGGSDSNPSARIIGSPAIIGSSVSTLAGDFVAGNTYRLTCTIVTTLQPAIKLYSHVVCNLPQ